jgi:hypothetical protein
MPGRQRSLQLEATSASMRDFLSSWPGNQK